MPDEKSQRQAQQKDVAARARHNYAWSSDPFGSGNEIPDAYVSSVQSGMAKQGAQESRKIGYEKDESGKRLAGSYKRGGMVKRTGMAKVHRGERVLTKGQAKRFHKRGGRK
jgi:hypothetical protein